jgi:hypothetical protein
MNLDELVIQIRGVSSDTTVQRIADHLVAWKDSPDTAAQLADTIERVIGQTWIPSDSDHSRVYALWSDFRRERIEAINGMTMNERLYAFGLMDRFYSLQSDSDRRAYYPKLHAGEA